MGTDVTAGSDSYCGAKCYGLPDKPAFAISDATRGVGTEFSALFAESHEMKDAVATTLTVLITVCALASAASGQSTPQPSAAAAFRTHSDSAKQPSQTITGRIVRLDVKSGIISVRSSDTGRILDLRVSKDVIVLLHRGQRAVVTYSDKTVMKIEATRSVQ